MQPVAPALKMYLRIGEVARLLEVKPSVIRFWETEFYGLRPRKSSGGQRVFSRRDVERLRLIKHLVHERGFTLDGPRRHLRAQGVESSAPAAAIPVRATVMRDGLMRARDRLVRALGDLDASAHS